jgi:hypothetical protein
VPRSSPKSNIRVICGMPILIGNASVDPGILMDHKRETTSRPDATREDNTHR